MITAAPTNIIQAHASPISPRSVMTLSEAQPRGDLKLPIIFDQQGQDTSAVYHEASTAYCGCYTFTPCDDVLVPIMRTALASRPDVAARVWNAILDDVLEHQMQLEKSCDNDSTMFCGYIEGQRIVVARVTDQVYNIVCGDKGPAETFLRFLKAHDVIARRVEEYQ